MNQLLGQLQSIGSLINRLVWQLQLIASNFINPLLWQIIQLQRPGLIDRQYYIWLSVKRNCVHGVFRRRSSKWNYLDNLVLEDCLLNEIDGNWHRQYTPKGYEYCPYDGVLWVTINSVCFGHWYGWVYIHWNCVGNRDRWVPMILCNQNCLHNRAQCVSSNCN